MRVSLLMAQGGRGRVGVGGGEGGKKWWEEGGEGAVEATGREGAKRGRR